LPEYPFGGYYRDFLASRCGKMICIMSRNSSPLYKAAGDFISSVSVKYKWLNHFLGLPLPAIPAEEPKPKNFPKMNLYKNPMI
jgi:hypothetical protein